MNMGPLVNGVEQLAKRGSWPVLVLIIVFVLAQEAGWVESQTRKLNGSLSQHVEDGRQIKDKLDQIKRVLVEQQERKAETDRIICNVLAKTDAQRIECARIK